MDCMRVKNWKDIYENNRTRELIDMKWVPVPNRHDGDGYNEIMDHPDGLAHFAAWILILQVASKCKHQIPQEGAGSTARPCDVRGSLMRGDKKPHDAKSLSRVTRCPEKVFREAIPRLIEVDWIEIITVKSMISENPAGGCGIGAGIPQVSTHRREGKGIEMESNKKEMSSSKTNIDDAHNEQDQIEAAMKPENPPNQTYGPQARAVLHMLNEVAGRNFRETDQNLKIIKMRLKEPGVEVQEIRKMIQRQRDMWAGTEFERYLRPETLFNATKFSGYYDDRDQPIKRGREAIRAQTEDTSWVDSEKGW
jgi:uncharacterized phage protein (TIGR02220 family)